MQDETKLLNSFGVFCVYNIDLRYVFHICYINNKTCFPCFSNIMFWCPLILKQQTLKIIILVTIDNNLYGSWIFKLCHTGDISMHIYLAKKREKNKEKKRKKTPKDRTKYVALQITATPRWKHSIRCLYNLSFIIFRWDFLRPFLRLRSTSLHLVFFSVRLKRN